MRSLIQLLLTIVILLFICNEEGHSCGRDLFKIEQNDTFNLPNPEISMDSLLQTLSAIIYLKPDTTRQMATKALDIATKNQMTEWEIILLNLIGVTYSVQSNYYKALEYFHLALNSSLRSNFPERTGDIYNNIGNINLYLRENKDAIENYLEAVKYYELAGKTNKVAIAHGNIGALCNELNNTEKSLFHLRKSMEVFLKTNDSIRLCETFYQIGIAYLKNNKQDSAMYYVDNSISIAKKMQNLYNLSVSYKLKADIYMSLDRIEESIEFYNKSKIIGEKIQNNSLIGNAYIGLANTYLKHNYYSKSLTNANLALSIIDTSIDVKERLDVYILLSKIYEELGEYDKSLKYNKLAYKIDKEIYDQAKLHQIYNMEIMQLSKDKEIQRLEIERQTLVLSRRNFIILFLIILSLSIILIAVLTYYFYINKIKQNQKIRMNEALIRYTKEKSKAALEAELQERKRLGIELHDGVGPLLSLIRMNITALLTKKHFSDERKSNILLNTLDTTNEVLKELKQISHNMAPVILIEKGFEAAIKTLVSKLNETNNFSVYLEIFNLNYIMEPYFEHALYRSTLEIINNIIWHANATEINIQIIQNNEDLTIMIEDNGVGFDTKQLENAKGLGLKNTISRIENLNGQFFLDTKKGKGTIVTMIIPIKQNKK